MTVFATTHADPIALLEEFARQRVDERGQVWGEKLAEALSPGVPTRPRIQTGDLVLLVEQCPTCSGSGIEARGGERLPCRVDWVVAGYLTATVLPIYEADDKLVDDWEWHPCVFTSSRTGATWIEQEDGWSDIDLPGAEPGGVAVTFEPVPETDDQPPGEGPGIYVTPDGYLLGADVPTDFPTSRLRVGAAVPGDIVWFGGAP